MTKKQKNKTTEDKDETIIEMAPIIKEVYEAIFNYFFNAKLTFYSFNDLFFIWFSSNDFGKKFTKKLSKVLII